MTQVKLEGFVPSAAMQKPELKISLRLHSIIMLVGPDGSGKSEFAMGQLMLQLKMAQVGKKKIKVSYISIDQVFSELLDDPAISKDSIEAKRVTEHAHDIIFNKIKNLTSYPVNSDFVIIDSTCLDPDFRAKVLEIGEENHYNVSALIFAYDDKSQYQIIDRITGDKLQAIGSQMKELKVTLSGGLLKKDYTSVERITTRDFNKYEVVVEDYSAYDQYVLPEDKEYVIFGDIHGCYDEFVELLGKNGFIIDENGYILD